MAKDANNIARRNADILKDYESLRKQRKYTVEYILDKLAKDYYISVRSVERVVYGKGRDLAASSAA